MPATSFNLSLPVVWRMAIASSLALVSALASPASPAATAGRCSVHSASIAPPVVELYTSEGCNSCPPADQWLSRLKADAPVVALAFHVDYWDRLGWTDRYASPTYTQRQTQQQRVSGARFSYTPQVIVDGVDHPDWQHLGTPTATGTSSPAPVAVQLSRDGQRVSAMVSANAAAPKTLAAYWAVTEQGHVSNVKAGENAGVTLNHDFVVRDYRPVPAWPAQPGSDTTLQFELAGPADPAHPQQVNLVIVNADTGRPVQAVKLGC